MKKRTLLLLLVLYRRIARLVRHVVLHALAMTSVILLWYFVSGELALTEFFNLLYESISDEATREELRLALGIPGDSDVMHAFLSLYKELFVKYFEYIGLRRTALLILLCLNTYYVVFHVWHRSPGIALGVLFFFACVSFITY